MGSFSGFAVELSRNGSGRSVFEGLGRVVAALGCGPVEGAVIVEGDGVVIMLSMVVPGALCRLADYVDDIDGWPAT